MPTKQGLPMAGEIWEWRPPFPTPNDPDLGRRFQVVRRQGASAWRWTMTVLIERPAPLAPIEAPYPNAAVDVLSGNLVYVGPGPELARKLEQRRHRKRKQAKSQLDKILAT